jgi:hypothetical protein
MLEENRSTYEETYHLTVAVVFEREVAAGAAAVGAEGAAQGAGGEREGVHAPRHTPAQEVGALGRCHARLTRGRTAPAGADDHTGAGGTNGSPWLGRRGKLQRTWCRC